MNDADDQVFQNPEIIMHGSSRAGTYLCDPRILEDALGPPHERCGDKTTMEWYFETPAGPASLYDYWWNRPGEWSIGAHSDEAAEYLTKHLDHLLGR